MYQGPCVSVDGGICAIEELNTGVGGNGVGSGWGGSYVAVIAPNGDTILYSQQTWDNGTQYGTNLGDGLSLSGDTSGQVMATVDGSSVGTGYSVMPFTLFDTSMVTSQMPNGTIKMLQGNSHPADPILSLAVGVTTNSGLYVPTRQQAQATHWLGCGIGGTGLALGGGSLIGAEGAAVLAGAGGELIGLIQWAQGCL
jgi:hypothetical protein